MENSCNSTVFWHTVLRQPLRTRKSAPYQKSEHVSPSHLSSYVYVSYYIPCASNDTEIVGMRCVPRSCSNLVSNILYYPILIIDTSIHWICLASSDTPQPKLWNESEDSIDLCDVIYPGLRHAGSCITEVITFSALFIVCPMKKFRLDR